MTEFSRRKWLALAGMTGVAMAGRGAMGAVTQIHSGGGYAANPFARSVLEFGARGDARKDNTAAFQKALDAAHSAGGGIVHVPVGRYLFKGHLTMPSNTSLEGVFLAPPCIANTASGSMLLSTEGRGRADGPPFIGVNGWNCTIRGLGIYYPDQDPNATEPVPYPWAIGRVTESQVVEDMSVIDVALTNPYQGINLAGAPRHYIARVYGHPIKTGLIADHIEDIGRIENIHFWPFWPCTGGSPVCNWIQAHGTSFIFGRSDWQYVFNTFSWGYRIGYQFIQTPSGTCNGNFLGIGADSTFEALRVDAAQPASGLLITNGEFASQMGAESQGFVIGPKNTAQVSMNNCAFWGPSNRIGTIQGTGPVSMIGCNFQAWDKRGRGEPAILCDGAPTNIMGCQFLAPGKKKAVRITKGCAGAVITGNTSMGSAFTVDRPSGLPRTRFQIHSNIACPSQWRDAF